VREAVADGAALLADGVLEETAADGLADGVREAVPDPVLESVPDAHPASARHPTVRPAASRRPGEDSCM
jgi:hypothetical protein